MRITPWNTIPPASKAWAVFFKVGGFTKAFLRAQTVRFFTSTLSIFFNCSHTVALIKPGGCVWCRRREVTIRLILPSELVSLTHFNSDSNFKRLCVWYFGATDVIAAF